MPRAIDLATVPPERAEKILRSRQAKRDEYLRRKETLLARNQAWREANPDKARGLSAQWRAANKERKSATTHAWYERNRDLCLERASEANRNLVDSVVKSRFCLGTGLQSKDVPAEMVPALRLSLQIRKELRAQKQ